MNNSVNISEQVLKEIDDLLEKAGVSKETFLRSIADHYNMSIVLEKKIIDLATYYDSFIA
jgi:hypothetical protein